MPLTKLQFRPGINQDITSYSNEGGWRDCDKVRFRLGFPEKIGGWEKYSSSTYLGSARALHNWIALDGSNYLGVGTHLKYYIEEGGGFSDITPIRETTSAGAVTFAATNGSSIITVTDTSHGCQQNDFVTFSDAATLGGNVTAAILNAEHQVTTVVDANTYTITVSVTANASDTGNGGASVVAEYQINVGLDTTVGGTGWGAGSFGGPSGHTPASTTLNGAITAAAANIVLTSAAGFPTAGYVVINGEVIQYTGITTNTLNGCTRGLFGTTASAHSSGDTVTEATYGWGMPSSLTTTTKIRLWTHDNFGENLLINPRDSGIYYWQKTSGIGARAEELSSAVGSPTSVPTLCKQVMVSDRDRHVLAFGCDGLNASSSAAQGDGVQDPLLIRFSDQENPGVWYPSATNTAGDLRLGSGSTFVKAIETKREILVWTDTALSSLRFIGPPFTFGLQQLANNITVAGPNAVAATEDFVFWMGLDNFYVNAGQTAQLPCTVKDKVFQDINLSQLDKVYAGVNSEFGEVWWLYPSAESDDNDRYVIYNYMDKIWYFGAVSRTAWLDRGTRLYPIAAEGGYLYNHEFGFDNDGLAMETFIESAVIDIGDGDRFVYLRRLIPDLTFVGSTALSSPQATFTVKARNFPGQNFSNTGSGTASRTQTSPVEEYTDQLDLRIRGRSFALRVDGNALGSKWKLGSPRVDVKPDGRR